MVIFVRSIDNDGRIVDSTNDDRYITRSINDDGCNVDSTNGDGFSH